MHPLLGTWPATQSMCPDWKLNWRPFSSQARAQSTEPHQPGLCFSYDSNSLFFMAFIFCSDYLMILLIPTCVVSNWFYHVSSCGDNTAFIVCNGSYISCLLSFLVILLEICDSFFSFFFHFWCLLTSIGVPVNVWSPVLWKKCSGLQHLPTFMVWLVLP